MNDAKLRKWLSQDRRDLVNAVAEAVRNQVAALNSQGVDFYGFALLPGEPYDIRRLVAVVNCESDIKVKRDDDRYIHYRYSIDEWSRWQHNGFETVNELLNDANTQFAKMHIKDRGDYMMDEYEILHSEALLEAIVQGLATAKESGVFGDKEKFLAIWISDSSHEIITNSVQRLNSESVTGEFLEEFGES